MVRVDRIVRVVRIVRMVTGGCKADKPRAAKGYRESEIGSAIGEAPH